MHLESREYSKVPIYHVLLIHRTVSSIELWLVYSSCHHNTLHRVGQRQAEPTEVVEEEGGENRGTEL